MQGTFERKANTYVFSFERHLSQPVERVWKALTDPSELTKWIAGDKAEMELRVGGRVWFSGHGGIESTVVDLEPERAIEYGWRTSEWEGGLIRWEIEPDGDGTKLTFTHRMPVPDPAEQE